MKTGKFLTFEGLDGGGKSTQAKHLAQWLRDEHGLNVVETREPGGTPLGEKLRQLVLAGKAHDPISETLLMLTARCEHISKVIKPALAKGEWVVCDRFADSTYAYQGGGRGVDEAFIQTTSKKVQDGIFPDMTFYVKTRTPTTPRCHCCRDWPMMKLLNPRPAIFIGEWRVLMKKLPSGKNRE